MNVISAAVTGLAMVLLASSNVEGSPASASAVKNCYTFHDTSSTWQAARQACENLGAHLVTMETQEEWKKVKILIVEKIKKDPSYTRWYIGLRKKDNTSPWKWIEDGSPDVVPNDNRWQHNEPSSQSTELCGEINAEYPKNMKGHFNNIKCDHMYRLPRGYICEKK